MKLRTRRILFRRQAGVVLIAALIALAAMTLAGIALVRSMDTGLLIAGNLAFKQASLNAAERGTEEAIRLLQEKAATSTTSWSPFWSDGAFTGYYATFRDGCDLTGNRTKPADDDVSWRDADHPGGTGVQPNCLMDAVTVPGMPAGYSASFVVNRMCSAEGKPGSSVACATYLGQSMNAEDISTKRGLHYPEGVLTAPDTGGVNVAYYRITTRVLGPRNAVSYVQVLVGFM